MEKKICRQIDELGRLVIPAELRERYGIKPRDKVWFTELDGGIFIHSENKIYSDDHKKL